MKYSELVAGRVITCNPYTLSEQEILEFARQFDPQPFHIDKEQALQTRWKGLIASGFHTCAIAMRMVAAEVLPGSGSMGSPGLDYVKWPHPVRPGDTLTLKVNILESKRSNSGNVGVIHWQWQLFNQDEIVVLDLAATSLFTLKVEG